MEEKRKRITQSTVIGMGFTKSMLKLLPEPMLADNPHCRSAPKMKLWYEDDVITVMASPDYNCLTLDEAANTFEILLDLTNNEKYRPLIKLLQKIGGE